MIELHCRKLFFDIYEESQKQNVNPWISSDQLPIVKREIDNGILFILKRNKDLKREYINYKVNVVNNELIFGIITELE